MNKHTLYQISTFALIAVLVGLFVYGTKPDDVKTTKAQSPVPDESLRYVMEMMDISLRSGSNSEYTGNEFIDLNGDGLTDFLSYNTTTSPSSNQNGVYHVYKNNGNNTYQKIYDCSWSTDYSVNPPRTAAGGDCAHLASSVSGVPQFFTSYASWPSSRNINYANDITYQMLNDMVFRTLNPNIYGWDRTSRFIDVNSDGLVDLVYKQFSSQRMTTTVEGMSEQQYAILLNKGNFTFTPAYKCFGYLDFTNRMIYYGDCIQP